MTEYLAYTLKTGALLAVFYLFFRLLLASERCHRLCRVVLLLTVVLSFVLPLCIVTMHSTVELPVAGMVPVAAQTVDGASSVSASHLTWVPLAFAAYLAGVFIMLSKTLVGVWSVGRLLTTGRCEPQADGTVMVESGRAKTPFSWFKYIVLPPDDFKERNALVIAHEQAHCRLNHSADVLLVDLLSAFQWFNPAMWLLRTDLRAIHEFEADRAVLSQGIDARQYQYLLVKKAVSQGGYYLANGFTHSTLKQRINMMQRTDKAHWGRLKALYILPVVLMALAMNAREVIDYKLNTEVPAAKPAATAVANENETVAEKQQMVENQQVAGFNTDTIRIHKECSKGEPLVVVDGKIVPKEEVNALSADLIQFVDVLKGDAATDKYGEKGANGVMVITLKTSGKPEPDGAGLLLQSPVSREKLAEEAPEEMPEFPGGQTGLMEFLRDNLQYPSLAVKMKVEGRVLVSCVIAENGDVTKVQLEKGVEPNLDQEALRVVKKMPRWTPGKKAGKPVAVKYCIPITFKLN